MIVRPLSLEPSQRIRADSFPFEVGEAYNFTRTGAGTYDIIPRAEFLLVDTEKRVSSHKARFRGAFRSRIKGRLASFRHRPFSMPSRHSKRAKFVSCSASRQTAINTAAASAQKYVVDAKNYLSSNKASTARYKTWFGAWTAQRRAVVLDRFTKMSAKQFSGLTYDCSCKEAAVYAYVYVNECVGIINSIITILMLTCSSLDSPSRVYLCGAFWEAPNTGSDSKVRLKIVAT